MRAPWTGTARDALLGAAAACALTLGDPEVLVGFAVLAALALPVAAWLGLRPGARPLLVVFACAVAARVVLALIAHYGVSLGFFASDGYRYEAVGFELARYWRGEVVVPPPIHGPSGYYVWNALLFLVLGRSGLAPALANAAVGGMLAILVFRIAREISDARGAHMAAWLVALWPSLVLWSSLNLKDAFAILALLLVVRGAQRCGRRAEPAGLLLLAAGFLLLGQLRVYLVGIVAAAVALAALLLRLRAAPLPMGAAVGLVTLLLVLVAPAPPLELGDSLRTLDAARSELAVGGSAYAADADVSTPAGALRFLPVGLAYFLLAPAPWQLLNGRQLLTLPEMLAWYALMPLVLWGLVSALRSRFEAAAPVATVTLLLTVSYALVEGNLGTAYRHRAQVLALLLVFAGHGLSRWRVSREARRTVRGAQQEGPAASRALPEASAA